MSFNGSGTYVPPVGQPVATGTVIQSSTFNALVTDFGNTFNNVLPRDGQAAMAGQLKIIDGTSSLPGIVFNSEVSTGIFRPVLGTLALVASGVEALRINSAGRVLIGTTTDDGSNTVQVNGSVKVAGAFNAAGAVTLASTLNVSSTVTAPSFVGTLNGNVTGNVSGTAANITGVVAVANGGTGATTVAAALANLGAASTSSPTITKPTIKGYIEQFQTLNPGAAVTINPDNGTLIELSITQNITITLPASVAGISYTIIAAYTGAFSLSFAGGTNLRWAGGTAPASTSANGKADKYVFTCGSTYTLAQDGGRSF